MERGAWWATVHGVTETDTMEPAHACAHTCLWKTRKKLVETKAKSCLKSVVVFCCPPPGACMVPSRDRKWGRRRGQRETEGELNLSLLAWVLTPSIFLLYVMSPICLLKHEDKCHDERDSERFSKHPRCLKAENFVGLKKGFFLFQIHFSREC